MPRVCRQQPEIVDLRGSNQNVGQLVSTAVANVSHSIATAMSQANLQMIQAITEQNSANVAHLVTVFTDNMREMRADNAAAALAQVQASTASSSSWQPAASSYQPAASSISIGTGHDNFISNQDMDRYMGDWLKRQKQLKPADRMAEEAPEKKSKKDDDKTDGGKKG